MAEPSQSEPPSPERGDTDDGAVRTSARPTRDGRRIHIGWLPMVNVAWIALLTWATPILAALLPAALYQLATRPELQPIVSSVAAGVLALTWLLGCLSFLHLRRLQGGTRGRTRLLFLTAAFPLELALSLGIGVMVTLSLTPAQANIVTEAVAFPEVLAGLAPGAREVVSALFFALGLVVTTRNTMLIASWFLLPPRTRRGVWHVVDASLVAYLVGCAVFALVAEPSAPGLVLEEYVPWRFGPAMLAVIGVGYALGRFVPALRSPVAWVGRVGMLATLAIALRVLDFDVPEHMRERVIPAGAFLATMALLAIRSHARWIPVIIDGIESMGFRTLVAARHLRTRKSDFLATISVLSISAVMLAASALCVVLSVMGGFRNDLKQKILGNHAHVVVDLDHETFGDWRPLLEGARNTPGVSGASPYVSGEVMVTSASNLAGAVLRGVDPESVDDVIDLRENMTRGNLDYLVDPARLLDLPPEDSFGTPLPMIRPRSRGSDDSPFELPEEPEELAGDGEARPAEEMFDASDAPEDVAAALEDLLGPAPRPEPPERDVLPGLIVGRELARSLRLYVGDEVNVVSPFGELGPTGPMPKSRPYRIAGIFYSGMYEYDMKYMYALLPNAQRFLNVGDEVSGIEIKVQDINQAPAVAGQIPGGLGRDDLRVQDWQELNRNLFGALELERLAMFIFLGLAILVAGFCVFATITLMVQEKSPQVGILKAMGTSSQSIVTVFLIEGFLIGVFGAEMGLGLGYILCFAAEHFGVQMNPEVYYIDRLPVHVDPVEFTLVGVAAVGICTVATVFPAVLASLMRPIDALRYE